MRELVSASSGHRARGGAHLHRLSVHRSTQDRSNINTVKDYPQLLLFLKRKQEFPSYQKCIADLADADVAATSFRSLAVNSQEKSLTLKTARMSNTVGDKQDSAALFVLSAVFLALITILSVWKLKQFKYRLINEAGAAMFYGR